MKFGIFDSNANGRIELMAADFFNRAVLQREFFAIQVGSANGRRAILPILRPR